MASLNTFSFLSIFLLLLHIKIAKTDFLAPLLSPLIDDACKKVECGKGKCKASMDGGMPYYICECDPGWKQTFSDKDDHAHLKFLPCIVPNCTMSSDCSAAPSPVQEKPTKVDQSVFDVCRWTDCGGGTCNKTTPFTYDCRCSEDYFNLLNISSFPCYKECAIGVDCADLGISMTNKSSASITPVPSVSQNDVNRAGLKLQGTWHWVIVLVLLLAMVA